jgi:hypothetical protein
MPTFIEILPAQKSSPRNALQWTPGDVKGTGIMVVETARSTTRYAVTEFPTDWDGRAFHLAKLTPGTDKEADSYNVFCARNQQDHNCDCRGFFSTSHCKHVDAVSALLDNEYMWSRSELQNGEQDVSNTEPPF